MRTYFTTQKSKLALVLVVVLLAAPHALAVYIHTGDVDASFINNGNWPGGVGTAPSGVINDSISFAAAANTTIANADPAISGITGIDFDGATAIYSISGAGSWTFDSGGVATFGGTSGLAHTVNVAIVNTDGINFNDTDNLTLGGIISGVGGITQSGASTLTLTGANAYSGGTTLSAGTIVLGNDSALGSGGLSVTANAAIQSDNNVRSVLNAVSIGDGVTLTYSGAFDLALTGDITGATGTLEVTGSALTLSGTNTHGTTDLNGGAIIVGSNSALGGALTVTSSGTISSNGAYSMATGISISGGQALTVDGTNNMALTGDVTGTGALTKSGTGTLTLSGINDYSGNTTLNAGTIILGDDSALGAGNLLLGGDAAIQSDNGERSVSTAINVGGNKLTVSGASDLALTGDLSGAGTVSKDGAGTLTLSGTNNAQGETELLAGTIVLGSDTALGIGLTVTTSGAIQSSDNARAATTNISIVGGQVLTVSGTNNLELSGILSEAGALGALTKSGTSILTLSGVNTYTGLTTLSAGTLALTGQVAGGVTVGTDALLKGAGTIGGTLTVNDGGSFAPGNSIGTMVVTGDFTLATGATLEIEVEKTAGPTLSSDLVDVSGNAVLQAGSIIEVTDISLIGQVIGTGDTFTIITAGAPVTDSGAIVNSLSAGLSFAGQLNVNNYELLATRTALSVFAATSNNAALLAAIDSDMATAAGDYADVINELSLLTAGELNAAAEQLNPVPFAAAASMSARTNQYIAGNLSGYLKNRRMGTSSYALYRPFSGDRPAMYADASFNPQMLSHMLMQNANTAPARAESEIQGFAQPFGMYYDQDSTDELVGFRARSTGGLFGADMDVAPNLIVGIGGGYSYTCLDFEQSRGDGHINSFYVGPYASWFEDDYFVDTSLTFGYHKNELQREINFGGINRTAESDYDAYDLSAYIGGGRNYYLVDGWTMTPTASIQYSRYCAESFSETGADAAGLDVDATAFDSLRSRLGFELSTITELDGITVIPELFVGWGHEFLDSDEVDSRFVSGAAKFTTDIEGDREDSVFFGAGLSTLLTEDVSAFIRYEGECYRSTQTNAVTTGITLLF